MTARRWSVCRVWDDGRQEVVVPGLTATQAERRAGKMRDAMTDIQCAEGWNYLAVRARPGMNVRTGLKAPGVPR